MVEPNPAVEGKDPFSKDNIGTVNFIVLSRLYDAVMALLKEVGPDAARDLLELHAQGVLLGSAPKFSGVFLTDVMNQDGIESER